MLLNGSRAAALLTDMGPRIPSSLKWLIDTRARLDGEIKRVEASTARAQRLLNELKQIKADLSVVDRCAEWSCFWLGWRGRGFPAEVFGAYRTTFGSKRTPAASTFRS